jgi:hypothetical protein
MKLKPQLTFRPYSVQETNGYVSQVTNAALTIRINLNPIDTGTKNITDHTLKQQSTMVQPNNLPEDLQQSFAMFCFIFVVAFVLTVLFCAASKPFLTMRSNN